MSLLNPEELRTLEDKFATKEYRLLAHELMNWDHTPSIDEGRDLAAKYGVSTENLRYVIRRLREFDLFTEIEGSVPLYRHALKMDAEQDRRERQGETPAMGVPVETGAMEAPLDGERLETAEAEAADVETPVQPEQVDEGRFRAVEEQIQGIQQRVNAYGTRMEGVEKHLGDIKSFMAQIASGQPTPAITETRNPSTPTAPEDPPLSPASSQAVDVDDPVGGYTREELVELLLEREPLERDTGRPRMQTITAPDPMVRRMIIEVTTYTQMLYERAVNDGVFEGTFADFLNWAPAKYFEDRDWTLGWHKFERAGRKH